MKLMHSYLSQVNYSVDDPIVTPGGILNVLGQELTLVPVPLHLREAGIQAGFTYEESEMVAITGYTLVEQLSAIKSLINRPSFSLVDKQIRMIGEAF